MAKVSEAKLTDFIPDPNNANVGTERGQAMIEDSIREDGAARSIVVDVDNVIVAGNKTHQSAVDAGLGKAVMVEVRGDELVVVKRTDFDLDGDDGRARRYAYRDNRSGELNLTWDAEQLLTDLSADVDLFNMFTDLELEAILGEALVMETREAPEPQMDKGAELAKHYGVQVGQIWQLGEHRLAVGDCTDKAVVDAVMRGEEAALCVTSPPYFVGKEYEQQKTEGEIIEFIDDSVSSILSIISKNRRIVINCATTPWSHIGGNVDYRLNLDWWQSSFRERGWLTRSIRIWSKHGGLVHNAPNADIVDMHWEFLATFYNPNAEYRGQNRMGEGWATSGIWDGIHGETQTVHSAPFPVIIPERFIRLYTDKGEIVFDPFVGSGTTLVSCEASKRRGKAIEILPGYAAVTLQRLADMDLEPKLLQ